MQRYRRCTAALLLGLATACIAPTGPDPSPVQGVWAAPVETLLQDAGPGLPARAVGTAQTWFSFSDGFFLSERHVFGGYGGEPLNQLSQIEQFEGRYLTYGDRITIETTRMITWVRSARTSSLPTAMWYRQRLFDGAAFGLTDSQLSLQWISYPDDSPHLTELTLTRSAQEIHSLGPLISRQNPRPWW